MTSMPDWLHFDDVWRTMNLRLLEERDDALARFAALFRPGSPGAQE